jgi:hypothetical protein
VNSNGGAVDLRRFFVERPNSLLITDPQGLNELRPLLPVDATVLDKRPRFPKQGELIVIGRRTAADGSEAATINIPTAAANASQGIQR